jgi:ferric-dicitrate binding protein FerR (iron transport regulator)
MRDLSPPQRDRVLQSSRNFQNFSPEQQSRIRQQFNQWDKMSPQQRANLREKENTWRNLTPEQRDHIKNDVLPKWRQMPWERQQVIQQKLGVLQNMPESARIRRLSDPNFTRGMSDEDRSTLHDLSHLHVGGAPDPPGNE